MEFSLGTSPSETLSTYPWKTEIVVHLTSLCGVSLTVPDVG